MEGAIIQARKKWLEASEKADKVFIKLYEKRKGQNNPYTEEDLIRVYEMEEEFIEAREIYVRAHLAGIGISNSDIDEYIQNYFYKRI